MEKKQPDDAATPPGTVPGPSTTPLREPVTPEELTGRASASNDDLGALFSNDTQDHFEDGFSGGSDDDSGVEVDTDDDAGTGEPGADSALE